MRPQATAVVQTVGNWLAFVWLCGLAIAACAIPIPPTPQPPQPPPQAKYVHAAIYQGGEVVGVDQAILELDDQREYPCTALATKQVACPLPPTAVYGWGGHLQVVKGDQRAQLDFTLAPDVNLELPPDHFDPSGVPLEELARIRGAMWTETWGCPLGPRPWQGDNVCATDFLWNYDEATRLAIVQHLVDLGYTHAVVGPIVDSDGYHGAWTPNDWRGKFDQFLDQAQYLWDHGLAPVVFIHPDGWSFEQTQGLTALFQQPRAQKLLRIIVPAGWEPTRYEWSNATWIRYMQWGHQTFPNAIIGIHTVSDVDAPVGTDALGDDNGKLPNGDAWGRITPYLHFWLVQASAYEHKDEIENGKTTFQNWVDLYNPSVRASYADRFQHGYAGWPTWSAWGPGKPMMVCAGEYLAYWTFWQRVDRSVARTWGDAAVGAGAPCYLDGGTRSVGPVSWQGTRTIH